MAATVLYVWTLVVARLTATCFFFYLLKLADLLLKLSYSQGVIPIHGKYIAKKLVSRYRTSLTILKWCTSQAWGSNWGQSRCHGIKIRHLDLHSNVSHDRMRSMHMPESTWTSKDKLKETANLYKNNSKITWPIAQRNTFALVGLWQVSEQIFKVCQFRNGFRCGAAIHNGISWLEVSRVSSRLPSSSSTFVMQTPPGALCAWWPS